MLYYWIRLAYIYFGATWFWKPVSLEADLSRERRVSLFDCEAFRYMSNARYFYYMDLIRFEILFRTKLYDNTFKKGVYPVLGSQKIIYKKPLKMGSRFVITLALDGWDDKWVYHRQIFSQGDRICAIGITKVAFWKDKKVQSMRDILKASGVERKDQPPSSDILDLFSNDHEHIKNAEKEKGVNWP